MPDKQNVLTAIAKLAKQLGRTPSLRQFLAHARISEYGLSKLFPSWSHAVRAAGLQPHRWSTPVADADLLQDWGRTARRNAVVPGRRAYRREGKHSVSTFETRFGHWKHVPEAFRRFAKGKPKWNDVVALLAARPASGPVPRRTRWHAVRKDRPTYGHPTPFRWLRHEPTNEQGVVLLFGMLAKDLGYLIEGVQNGFPDCEAKHQVAPGRWQRIRIEFEFESKNFRDHGHPPDGCDVIVCWRHNWPACPKHLEILELSKLIDSLGGSGD